ncbi:hypothetical protein N8843_07875 [Verrucomicrobia bacterium]|nr:hypothetical protein [Verrucomicrobiota bacterium]MDB4350634.1 hypothetical protein [Verrucomicrobiota bacterium]
MSPLVRSARIDSATQLRAFHSMQESHPPMAQSMNGYLRCPYLKAVAYEPGERIRTG